MDVTKGRSFHWRGLMLKRVMTELLQQAFDRAKALPESRQDELAAIFLQIVEQDESPLRLNAGQIAEVEQRLASPPDYATDEEVQDFFKRFGA